MTPLGQRPRARDLDRQIEAVQVHIADLNGGTALGIHFTNAVGYIGRAKGAKRP